MLNVEELNYYYNRFCDMEIEKIFKEIKKEILDKIGYFTSFNKDVPSLEKVITLKNEYIYYLPEYIDLFFLILAKHDYYFKQEIKDVIFNLSYLSNPNDNKEVIDKFINSPYIEDISFDGKNEYTIFSTQFGTIKFKLAKDLFKNNYMISKILNFDTSNECHNCVYYAKDHLENIKIITSLCPNYIREYLYYHSYILLNENNQVFDLCSKICMDKNTYDMVYEPREIVNIDPLEFNYKFNEAMLETHQSDNRCHLLIIALYNHLKMLKEEDEEYKKIMKVKETRCRK